MADEDDDDDDGAAVGASPHRLVSRLPSLSDLMHHKFGIYSKEKLLWTE